MNTIITLNDYLSKGKTFVIPSYQRGYVWGKKRPGDEKDSVTYLLDDIITRYHAGADIFLQGVTVTEKENEIILIDGQQRTTCLYIMLKLLGYESNLKLKYEIRKSSNDFLNSFDFINDDIIPGFADFQDIYFFIKSREIIKSKLDGIDRQDLLNYLLKHIKFLYINIEESQAIRVFTMMNGSKARMLQEEIIKAEILRLASKNSSSELSQDIEWEHNMLRSRYAREWDKWLHWWNMKEVQTLFNCSTTMGLLISSFYKEPSFDLTFEGFKNHFFKTESSFEAKKCFDGLRRLQKRFEDAFNDPAIHNMIGGILRILDKGNRDLFVKYYFVDDNRNNLETYYKKVFLGLTHKEIISDDKDKLKEKYDASYSAISNDFAYINTSVNF